MRLFIAAELPENLIETLSETSAVLRERVRGRYVGPDLFHVTLAFLGEVDAGRVDGAATAMEQALDGHTRFTATLAELGSFGSRGAATLWQGFDEASAEAFSALARDVRAALSVHGLPFDDKAFRPHVTLMRACDLSRGTLPSPLTATGVVDTVTLFKSDLTGARPVYTPLAKISF